MGFEGCTTKVEAFEFLLWLCESFYVFHARDRRHIQGRYVVQLYLRVAPLGSNRVKEVTSPRLGYCPCYIWVINWLQDGPWFKSVSVEERCRKGKGKKKMAVSRIGKSRRMVITLQVVRKSYTNSMVTRGVGVSFVIEITVWRYWSAG